MRKEIASLITKYAEVYNDFEKLQAGENSLLPGGDQKTGVIAEFYAKCYVEYIYGIKATYAASGESFDLSYTIDGKTLKIQVKGVSGYSKTRTIAPLSLINREGKPAFDQLYLIDLDRNFFPVALYINTYKQIVKKVGNNKTSVKGSKMKNTIVDNKPGSDFYDFKENKIRDLINAIS